jgi:hypothetical protein
MRKPALPYLAMLLSQHSPCTQLFPLSYTCNSKRECYTTLSCQDHNQCLSCPTFAAQLQSSVFLAEMEMHGWIAFLNINWNYRSSNGTTNQMSRAMRRLHIIPNSRRRTTEPGQALVRNKVTYSEGVWQVRPAVQ